MFATILLVVIASMGLAQGVPPGTGGGGGGSDTKGYEILNPNTKVHLCLTDKIDPVFGDPDLTLACNYNNPFQRWTAIRDGHWGYIKSNLGNCLRVGTSDLGLPNFIVHSGACDSHALWRRTIQSQWVNKALDANTCLEGNWYSNTSHSLSMETCSTRFTQRWLATG